MLKFVGMLGFVRIFLFCSKYFVFYTNYFSFCWNFLRIVQIILDFVRKIISCSIQTMFHSVRTISELYKDILYF